jgi:tetratricopeptide (TPR) repeat protein
MLGKVDQAVLHAKQSVHFADLSEDTFQKESRRTALADALHKAGAFSEAENLFREAEGMQKKSQTDYPYLYSLQGFYFCDLLLSQGKYEEVLKRATQTLKWVEQKKWLLDIALDQLALGRAFMMQACEEGNNDYTQAEKYLNQAVDGLRESGYRSYLPLGLLARAALFRVQQEFSTAWLDLEEAREIAKQSNMGFHLVDCHLEACRLCFVVGNKVDAQRYLNIAKSMIDEIGYHRRDKDARELTVDLEVYASLAQDLGKKDANVIRGT